MSKATRALSIRQPYVELILRGDKTVEYRRQPTKVRGPILLYAPKQLADAPDWLPLDLVCDGLPLGVVVGSATLVDCQETERHGERCYGYVLTDVVRFAKPRKPVGRPFPGFWFNTAS